MLNVVIVDGDLSYPTTSGKRLRTLNLLLPLARRHRLTYIGRGAAGDPVENRQAAEFLKAHGIEPVIVDDPVTRQRGAGFYLRLAGNVFSPLPYSVASHRSERMSRAVAEVAGRQRVDLWQVEWTGYQYAVEGQKAPVVVQAHNVDSLLWQRYVEAERNPLRRAYVWGQWRKFLRFERRALRSADRVIAVSPDDAARAREQFGVEAIDVVDNGVDVAYFGDVRPSAASRSVLYLGALDWRPNLDAARLLLGEVFPAVRARVAEARLALVGRRPPDWLRQLVARTPGAALHADVPDVRPYMSQSAVMAVPLRIGGGSRLKILEAAAAGLPVVSTRVGAEGLNLRPGVDYARADSPREMAEALAGALTQPEASFAMAREARPRVAARYDWSVLAARLGDVWERTAGAHEGRRPCTSCS